MSSLNFLIDYSDWIGKQVTKAGRPGTITPKPFKSKNRVNTVKAVVNHPELNVPAFTFFEDDSYVRCSICKLAI